MSDPQVIGSDRWTRTRAWYRALMVIAATIPVGLVTGRADLVVLGAPVALGVALAMSARGGLPRGHRPEVSSGVGTEVVRHAGATVSTRLSGLADAELITVRLPSGDGPQASVRTVPGGSDRILDDEFSTRRWGPTVLARPDHFAIGPDGLTSYGPVAAVALVELVLPAVHPIPPLTLPPITGGWAGAHRSRRPGQGTDLVDLREFAPGDRLRTIHWRALARHQRLFTRRTLSEADAELVLSLDTRSMIAPRPPKEPSTPIQRAVAAITEVAHRVGDRWAERRGGPGRAGRIANLERRLRTSADLMVDAATAIAAAHLGAGDRVGVMTTSRVSRRVVRAGTGTRHLQRIRYFLARTAVVPELRVLPVSAWGLRPGAVVVVISPLDDDEIADAVQLISARGHRVIVVDVAPIDGVVSAGGDLDHLRILVLEHVLRAERLRGQGIPVVGWEDGRIGVELRAAAMAGRGRS